MTLRSKPLAIITIGIFVVGIALSMAFNVWQTRGSRTPVRFGRGEYAERYNPADIRGSYSFDDVTRSFGVPVDVLARAFGVAQRDAGAFQAKQLEEMYGALPDGGEVGTDAIRLFASLYAGLPYIPESSTRLPEPAVEILTDRVDEATAQALMRIAVPLSELRDAAGSSAAGSHEIEGDTTIKGKTTFNDLLNWGLTKDEIESILNMTMGARSMTVRDFTAENGLSFGIYKAKLQELVDSKR